MLLPGCDIDRKLLYFPDRGRPDIRTAGVATAQEVRLHTEDGVDLLAWWAPPSGTRPVIVYFHGNGGHIGYRNERFHVLARQGFGALFPEYRGYGGNKGSPSEEGLYADARAALAFVDAQRIPPERLVLFGESLGSAVSVRMAAERRVGAVVLESPFTSIEALGKYHYPFLPVRLLLRDRFDVLAHIKDVRAPILMLHGERDTIVPIAFGEALFAAAPDPKEVWIAPNGGHNDLRDHGGFEAVTDFLRRRLSF
jgi:fermentation-respiration switch protein FrsA (DUF1100 family)